MREKKVNHLWHLPHPEFGLLELLCHPSPHTHNSLPRLSSKAFNKSFNLAGLLTLLPSSPAFPCGYCTAQWTPYGGFGLFFELTAAGLFGIFTRFPFNAVDSSQLSLSQLTAILGDQIEMQR